MATNEAVPKTPSSGTSIPAVAVVTVLLLAGWMLILRKIGNGNVYAYLGPYGLVVVAASELIRRRGRSVSRARTLPHHAARDVGVGLGVGVVMTAGTYLAYPIVSRLVPSLPQHVADLYAAARAEALTMAIAWTAVVLVAEEILWRGVLYETLGRRLSPMVAGALSLAAYVLVEIGSGSWVLALAALVCGAIWTAERIFTRSLLAPILSHGIWTIVVIHVRPVIGQ